MLSVGLTINGRQKQVDLHDLPIGDTYCHRLGGPDLFAELRRLKVKNIDPSYHAASFFS